MRLAFTETMYGQTADGRRFGFRVTAEAARASGVLLAEMLRLEGVAELEGVAREAPAEGTLVIGLPWRPYLEYEVAFRGDDGAQYRFAGKKTVRVLRLLTTMTTLPGTIYKDGAPYAEAVLRFQLRDLPSLVSSVRLFSKVDGAPELHAKNG